MKILLVVATGPEIAPLAAHFNLSEKDFAENPEFDILVTGVGMTATAFALGKHLSSKYNLVLNLGIAGCFDRNIELGTVLNIVTDEFAELGAETPGETEDTPGFIKMEELGFGKNKYTAYHNLLNEQVNQLRKVSGITVNKVHGDSKSILSTAKRLNPTTESMEGAAVFYCCQQANIPCLQIRSISNYVEPRNKENWKIGLAVQNLNNWAIRFLTNT